MFAHNYSSVPANSNTNTINKNTNNFNDSTKSTSFSDKTDSNSFNTTNNTNKAMSTNLNTSSGGTTATTSGGMMKGSTEMGQPSSSGDKAFQPSQPIKEATKPSTTSTSEQLKSTTSTQPTPQMMDTSSSAAAGSSSTQFQQYQQPPTASKLLASEGKPIQSYHTTPPSSDMGSSAATAPTGGTATTAQMSRGLHATPASRRLMVFVDGTMEADRAFYAALQWLRETDHLSAVYVVDHLTLHPLPASRIALFGSSAPGAEQAAHAAREKVHRLISRYAGMAREAGAHNVQAVAISTSPDRSISEEAIHYAQQMKVDCVLTGTRSQGALKRFFMGSFSTYLLNNSPCDVLVIKSDAPGRRTLASEETPIAQAAFEAHRSLHEGNVGGFAGHSAPEFGGGSTKLSGPATQSGVMPGSSASSSSLSSGTSTTASPAVPSSEPVMSHDGCHGCHGAKAAPHHDREKAMDMSSSSSTSSTSVPETAAGASRDIPFSAAPSRRPNSPH